MSSAGDRCFQQVARERDELLQPERLVTQLGAEGPDLGRLVVVLAVRELDLAILLPGANQSAAVRYFNALHFARDGFVAALGLLIAALLFLPVMLHAAWSSLRKRND